MEKISPCFSIFWWGKICWQQNKFSFRHADLKFILSSNSTPWSVIRYLWTSSDISISHQLSYQSSDIFISHQISSSVIRYLHQLSLIRYLHQSSNIFEHHQISSSVSRCTQKIIVSNCWWSCFENLDEVQFSLEEPDVDDCTRGQIRWLLHSLQLPSPSLSFKKDVL